MFTTKTSDRDAHARTRRPSRPCSAAPARQIGIGVHAPRHAQEPEEVLHEERQVEADDHQPEVRRAPAARTSSRPLIFGNQ